LLVSIPFFEDNVTKFEEEYDRVFKNYSSFITPYKKWNHKIRNYLIKTESKAMILFTRKGFGDEKKL